MTDWFRDPEALEAALRSDGPPDLGPRGYEDLLEMRSGAQGTVYSATRSATGDRVAIKVMHHSANARGRVRFQREIELVSTLRHPGIVSAIDRGETADGRAFFVMRYIEGLPLHEYLESRQLPRDQRLALFTRICDIVAAAHRRGVIHRDLKPSNIRVDPAGKPHVLDFGLAHLETPDRSEDLTLSTHFLGTIAYATPEQATGAETDTRSDVYALGVILYEMLAGHRPYDTEGTFSDALKAIERADPRPIRRKVGADLEAIALKALRKDPDRRYQSVDSLADDIRRHVAGEPISAIRGSARADLMRLVRRHRATASLLFVIAMLCILVAGGSAAALAVINNKHEGVVKAKQDVEDEAAKVAALVAFYEQMFDSVRPDQAGADVRVIDLLDDAAARLDSDLDTDPEIRSFMHHRLGHSYLLLGSHEAAISHLERAAEAMKQAGEPEGVISVEIDLAQALAVRGEVDRAETLMHATLTNLLAIPGHSVVLESQLINALAAAANARSDYAAAEPMYERALELMLEGDSGRMELAAMYNNLGMTKEMLYKLDEATDLYAASLELVDSDSREDQYARASITHNLGNLANKAGNYPEAERRFREALEISSAIFGGDHPAVAETLETFGAVLIRLGKLDEAEQNLSRCRTIREAVFPAGHPKIASVISTQAELRFAQARYRESIDLHRAARDLRAAALGPDHWLVGKSEVSMSRTHTVLEEYDQAWTLLERGARTILDSGGSATAANLGVPESAAELAELWPEPPPALIRFLDELIVLFPDGAAAERLEAARE